ncbi:hypothetical protein Efla_007774 [Eimeria flavescens]
MPRVVSRLVVRFNKTLNSESCSTADCKLWRIDVQQQARNALQPWDIADDVLLAYTCDYRDTPVASRDKAMKDV